MVNKKAKTKNAFSSRNKKERSPNWDGHETWSAEKFTKHFHEAQKYYNTEDAGKSPKQYVINWMSQAGYDNATIRSYKKTKDWRTSTSVGGIAANLIKGMPSTYPGFNNNRNTELWLREQIAEIISDGSQDIEVEDAKEVKAETTPVLNIQERISEHAGTMCEEIEEAIDSFIADPDKFDPSNIKIANMLRIKGAKGPQARYIKGFYESNYKDLSLIVNGDADPDLKEGYRRYSKKNIKKLYEFYESISIACDQIIAEAKILKKPRKKKFKSAEDITKKVKFKLSDDKLGITSVPVSQIVGAQGVVVFNTKNRKIGYYVSSGLAGLHVKGASIADYSTKSMQKTLRKPPEQIKEFKEQNTQKRFESWFKNIKTTETALNGRLNEDTIILKVYK
jgi:hypothetical protein